VRVVPLFVRFGAEEFRVGVDLSTEQFWTRMLAPDAPFPATASPSPGTFREAFEACFAEGADAIVCPTIGSKLSATFQSATLAARALPDREIHVIDTGSTSMATGIPALLAAEMAAAGAPAAEIAARRFDSTPSCVSMTGAGGFARECRAGTERGVSAGRCCGVSVLAGVT